MTKRPRLTVSDFRTMVRLPGDFTGALAFLGELRERFDQAVSGG